MAGDVEIGRGVAGGGDEDDAGVTGGGDGGEFRLRKPDTGGLAVTGVDDVGAAGDGVIDAGGDVGHGAAAGRRKSFDRHELDLPRDPGDADVVIADGADRARDVRAVAAVVGGVAADHDTAAADEVGAVAIIGGGGRGIDPEIGGEVLMGEVQAGIHDGDDDVGRVADQVPRGEGLDVGAGDAA